MRDLEQTPDSLRGQLLIAHPALLDPNFRRALVLLSEHSSAEGALGIILNRPLGQTLGELRPVFAGSALEGVPVYEGGPVRTEEVILVAWRASTGEETGSLRFYFGTSPEKVAELLAEDAGYQVRAYLGHAGWGGGQLEGELSENAWLLSPVSAECFVHEDWAGIWRELVLRLSPELRFLVDAPDDPSLN
jgi:putative transcriptional regulator